MAKPKLPDGLAKRGRYYHADFCIGGRRIRQSLKTANKTVATQIITDLKARAQRSEYGLLDNDFRVEDLRKQYLRHCRQTLKPSTVERYENCFKAILPQLPARVSRITIESVLAYRERRLAQGIGPETINKEVKVTNGMFRWGVQHRLLKESPLAGVRRLPHDHPKEGRALTPEEVKRLLAIAPKLYRDIWYCFLVTGMRKSEVAALLFTDIDWKAREVVVQRSVSKTHRPRRIPIDDHLWDILRHQYDGRFRRCPAESPGKHGDQLRAAFSRDHVFVTRYNTSFRNPSLLYSQLMAQCKRAGIETRTFDAAGDELHHVDVHSLRRTFATELIVTGSDPKTVQELLGHKTLEMTMNLYAKMHTGTKRQALRKLSWGEGTRLPDREVPTPKRGKVGHKMVTRESGGLSEAT